MVDRESAERYARWFYAPAPNLMDTADVYARINMLGDVGAKLNDAKGDGLAELYEGVDLQVRYEPETSIADVSMQVNSVRVGGRSCTFDTRDAA